MTRRPSLVALALLASAIVVTQAVAVALAHEIGLSRGVYRTTPEGIQVELSMNAVEATGIEPDLDRDGDGQVEDEELTGATPALRAAIESEISVLRAGFACRATRTGVERDTQDGLLLSAFFACEGPAGETKVRVGLLARLAHGHRQLAQVDDAGGTRSELLHAGGVELSVGPPPVVRAAVPGASTGIPWSGFLRMGIEHVVLGFDHLAFLFLLALSSPGLRSLALLTVSFTLAHSVALVWATLGGAAPPSDIVEPLIALSIAYVAVENLLRAQPRHRPLIVFGFGLVHGFGFAGALAEIVAFEGLLPLSLLAFNLGVELGQIAVLVLVVIALTQLQRVRGEDSRVVRALNVLGLVAGLLWTAERTYRAFATARVAGVESPERASLPFRVTASEEKLDDTADPRARELCAALHRLPGKRVAECCGGTPSEYLYGECVRVLNRSLVDGGVQLDADDVRRCVTAMEMELTGCDWVRPGMPRPARACNGLLRATREQGQTCRSSLECVGNLSCFESTSGSRGRCLPPADNGSPCGGSVDSLAALLLVRDEEERHPTCQGMCNRVTHSCEDVPALGAACRAHAQCGADRRCVGGACQAGASPPLQRARPGDACATDLDCDVGGCTTSAGGARVCGMRCMSSVLEAVGLASSRADAPHGPRPAE